MIINWIAIIISPILGYSTFKEFKKKPKTQKIILGAAGLIVLTFLLSNLTNIVFTLKILNEIMISFFYLSVCIIFWQTLRVKNKFIKNLLVAIGLVPMVFGLLLGTIGIIGYGLAYEQLWSDRIFILSENKILEITSLGNALDPGGIKVDLFQDIPFVPLKRKMISKTFDDFYINLDNLNYSFNKEKQEIKIWTEGNQFNRDLNEVIKLN